MDIVTNFAAGEEAVGAIFGGDPERGEQKVDDPTSSTRGSKRNNRKKKKELVAATEHKKPRGPPAGASSTKCSKNRVPTTRDLLTITSKTVICFAGTLGCRCQKG
jgi:hypothetical protein